VGRTLAQLQGELGVTKRTVQRDIATLEAAGFPIVSEARNGTVFWHFMEGFDAEAPVSLTLTEQMALYFTKGLCGRSRARRCTSRWSPPCRRSEHSFHPRGCACSGK